MSELRTDSEEYKEYVYFTKNEKDLIIKLVLLYSVLFTIFANYFSSLNWYVLLIPVTLFMAILFPTHLLYHKYCAYKQGFEMKFYELTFNRFHLETYETVTNRGWSQKPIPYSILITVVALFSIGFVIISNIVGYSHKKIDHIFFGKRKAFEYVQDNLFPQENTQLRQAYAHFFSNLYPLFFIVLFSVLKDNPLFFALLVISISYAFFQLFPLLPNMGFEYFIQHTFLWGASFGLFVTFTLYGLLFTSLQWFITVSITTAVVVLFIQFIRFTYKVAPE